MEGNVLDSDELQSPEDLSDLTFREIFIQIWFSPGKVFQFIHKNKVNKHWIALAIIYAVFFIFNEKKTLQLFESLWLAILGASLGMLIVILGVNIIMAFFSQIIGRMQGGTASFNSLLRVFIYCTIPLILPINLLLSLVSLPELSQFSVDPKVKLMRVVYSAIAFIPSVWSLVNYVVAVSVVQKFSIKKSLLNHFLSTLSIVFIAILIGYLLLNVLDFEL